MSQIKDRNFLADYKNWPSELDWQAGAHKQKSYFKVVGQFDPFDNLRASLFLYKRPAVLGLIWGWPLTQVFLQGTPSAGFGHAITAIGYDRKNGEDFLIIQNSYGLQAGDKGRHYLSRETYNTYYEMFGCFMFIDLPPDEAKFHNKWKLPLKYNWIAKIVFSFRDLLGMGSAR